MAIINLIRVFLIILFLFNNNLYGQNKAVSDSLIQLLNENDFPDSTALKILNQITLKSPSPDQVIDYSKELLRISNKTFKVRITVNALHRIGVAKRQKGELNESLNYLFQAADLAYSNDFKTILAETYNEIATTYTVNNDSKNALLYNSKAIQILRKTGDDQQLAINLLNTGYDYYLIGQLDSALVYYNEAEPIFEEIRLEIGKAYTIGNRALVFWKKEDTDRAINDLLRAIEMLEPLGDQFGMADYYNQLGSIYLGLNRKKEAIKYTEIGLDMAKAEDLKEQVRDASLLLAELYKQKQEYQKALDYQSQYIAYKDSIQDNETTKRLADLRTEFEVGQKQVEVDLANQQKRNRQNLALALGAILLLTGVYLFTVYRSSQKRKRLNDELRALNATKDKFFSIISHDLRGPVSAFSGIGRVIKMLLKKKSYEELDEMTGEIDKSANSLSDLLDNLLGWAVQQQGNIPYQPGRLDLSELATSNVEIFHSLALAKEISIVNHIKKPLFAFADKNMTMTMLRNLVGNALKFTDEGGTIDIYGEATENNVKISVKDSGVGMTQEVVQNLFVLEDKKSTYGTSGEKGLGLGLQLVHEFVGINKGKIQVDSTVGKGSTFSFWLPKSS